MIFDERYPAIAWWMREGGTIEFGREFYTSSLVRVLGEEGLLWESGDEYASIAAALDETEAFVARWAKENGYQIGS